MLLSIIIIERSGSSSAVSYFTTDDAKKAVSKIDGIVCGKSSFKDKKTGKKFTYQQLVAGMNVESEHGEKNKQTDVVRNKAGKDDPVIFAKIALSHLLEKSTYYEELKKIEESIELEHEGILRPIFAGYLFALTVKKIKPSFGERNEILSLLVDNKYVNALPESTEYDYRVFFTISEKGRIALSEAINVHGYDKIKSEALKLASRKKSWLEPELMF